MVKLQGISSLLAFMIILPLAIMVSLYIVHYFTNVTSATSHLIQSELYRAEYANVRAKGYYWVEGTHVYATVKNIGTITFTLKDVYLVYTIWGVKKTALIHIGNFTQPSGDILSMKINGTLTLEPGDEVNFELSFSDVPTIGSIVVITSNGRPIVLAPREQVAPPPESQVAVSYGVPTNLGELQLALFNLTSPDLSIEDASDVLAPGSPDNPGTGIEASTYTGVWCLYEVIDNATVSFYMRYSTAIIGYDILDGGGPNAEQQVYSFSIVLLPESLQGQSNYGKVYNDTVDVDLMDLVEQFGPVKIVVYGFKGSISNRYWYYSESSGCTVDTSTIGTFFAGAEAELIYDCDVYSSIDANGVAKRVYIYIRSSYCGFLSQVSYTPYLLVADTDGNGYPELIFTTEDLGFWSVKSGGYGDDVLLRYYWGTLYPLYGMDLSEKSSKPLIVLIKNPPIDSDKYSAALVSIRFFFHDNAGGDYEEIDDNEWIIRVGLYDPETGTLYSYQEFKYQLLCGLEDTYPPSINFDVRTVTLLVPKIPHKTFYVAVMFRDPYGVDSGYNDADITVGVEYVAIIPISSTIQS